MRQLQSCVRCIPKSREVVFSETGHYWVSQLLARPTASRYPVLTMDEKEFQKRCDAAFEELRSRLQEAGDVHGFEVEGGSGKLEVLFEEPEETRFVISPNTPVRQIWI